MKENIKKYGSDKIILQEIDSTKIDPTNLKKRKLRIFHVDGCHSFENAYSDLELAFSSIDTYGVVILDDFITPCLPGVTEAIYKHLFQNTTNDFFPFALGGGKLYLSHKDFVVFYRNALLDMMPMKENGAEGLDCMFNNKIAIYDMF